MHLSYLSPPLNAPQVLLLSTTSTYTRMAFAFCFSFTLVTTAVVCQNSQELYTRDAQRQTFIIHTFD